VRYPLTLPLAFRSARSRNSRACFCWVTSSAPSVGLALDVRAAALRFDDVPRARTAAHGGKPALAHAKALG
jgi:hypothetical protein